MLCLVLYCCFLSVYLYNTILIPTLLLLLLLLLLLSIYIHQQVVVTNHSSDDEDDSAPDFDGNGGGDVEHDEENSASIVESSSRDFTKPTAIHVRLKVDNTTHSSDENVDIDDDEGASIDGSGSSGVTKRDDYGRIVLKERRNIVIDNNQMQLTSEQMKAMLRDTSDIVQQDVPHLAAWPRDDAEAEEDGHDGICPALQKLPTERLLARPCIGDDGGLAPELLALWGRNMCKITGKPGTQLPFRMKVFNCSVCKSEDDLIQCGECKKFSCYGCALVGENDPEVVDESVPWWCHDCEHEKRVNTWREENNQVSHIDDTSHIDDMSQDDSTVEYNADTRNHLKKYCGWTRRLSTVDDLDDSMDDTIEKVREYLNRDGIVFKDCVNMDRLIARLLATYGGIKPVLERIRSMVKVISGDDDDTAAEDTANTAQVDVDTTAPPVPPAAAASAEDVSSERLKSKPLPDNMSQDDDDKEFDEMITTGDVTKVLQNHHSGGGILNSGSEVEDDDVSHH